MPRPHIHARSISAERVAEAEAFIRANLPLTEVPGTGIHLHLAGPRSGLSRLVSPGGTPYWAYAWPGGVALAMHLLANPEQFRDGDRPMDGWEFGAGSGLVSIAMRKAGRYVIATDPDPLALVAARLNAEANGVAFDLLRGGFAANMSPPEEIMQKPMLLLAGDVFYDKAIAALATTYFDRQPSYVTILVGDIGRRSLPHDRLHPLASYPVRDVGDPLSASLREGWVFRWKRP